MRNLELKLERIAILEKQKEKENYSFRIFLKGQDDEKVDRIVKRLNERISSLIDCTKCGNCCNLLSPSLSELEIEKLAKLEGYTSSEYKNRYIEMDNINKIQLFNTKPCRYLKNKICTIYLNRPSECMSYPHTNKSNFTSRMFAMIDNYGICPIVFNIMEELKLEMGFYRK
jgi:hypothetical protein